MLTSLEAHAACEHQSRRSELDAIGPRRQPFHHKGPALESDRSLVAAVVVQGQAKRPDVAIGRDEQAAPDRSGRGLDPGLGLRWREEHEEPRESNGDAV
jgi:hypothetical protein